MPDSKHNLLPKSLPWASLSKSQVRQFAPAPIAVPPKPNSHLVRSFPLNEVGRDFVVGDIHGAFDLVIQGMRQVKFNRSIDRLFSVGDPIDRGPGSHRVLEFLAQPYVHALGGNHGDAFASMSLERIRILGDANWNGMKWVKDVSDEKIMAIKEALSKLPVVMQVATHRGMVGIVHGEVPVGMHWNDFVEAVQQGNVSVIESALEGRSRLKSMDASGVDGIDRVFVGHSIQWDGPKRLGNVYMIDTGAVFRELDGDRGSLTMVNMACCTSLLMPTPGVTLPEPVVTHVEDGEGPFGPYAADNRQDYGTPRQ